MTVEQFVALIGAFALLTTAVAGLYREVKKTHALVNSRMDELLALTRKSSRAEGREDFRLSGDKGD